MKVDRLLRATILVAVAFAACADEAPAPHQDSEEPAALSLRLEQDEVWVRRGERASVSFSIEPANALETIAIVRARNLPEGVTAGDVVLEPGGGGAGELVLTASADARTGGPHTIEVEAVLGGVTRNASLDLTVAGLPGELDASFGEGGVLRYEDEHLISGHLTGFSATSAGIYVLRNPHPYHGQLSRLRIDGSIDRTFGVDGVISFEFEGGTSSRCSLAPVGSKELLVACVNRSESRDLAIVVQRLLEDGRADTSFGQNGVLEIPIGPDWLSGYRVLVTPDSADRILIATARLDRARSENSLLVWRATSAGELDPEWGEGAVVEIKQTAFLPTLSISRGSVIALANDQGYIITGELPADKTGFVVALDINGRLREDFGDAGILYREGPVFDAAQTENGTLYINEWTRVVALTSSGRLDPQFGVDGVAAPPVPASDLGYVLSLAPGPDGAIYGSGIWEDSPSISDPTLFRFPASGLPDRSFSERSRIRLLESGAGEAVTVAHDGRILVALQKDSGGYFAIARYWP